MNIIDRNREEIQTNGKKKNGDYSVLRDRVRDLLPSSYLDLLSHSLSPNLWSPDPTKGGTKSMGLTRQSSHSN